MKLVIWLMGVVAIAVILVIGFRIASENVIKPMVADRVENDINNGVQSIVGQELAALPISIDQPQEIMISEAELNQRIAEQQDLGPLDEARAEINSDGIAVHMNAYGLSGTYRAQVGVADGRAVIRDGSISGPLGYVIPVEDLERAANQAIATSLSSSEIQVTDVTLVDGEMVLTLESTGAGNDIPTG
jgi:hypothetical protein